MKTKDIYTFEDSPDTPAGSQSQDLNLGKLWLCRCLKRLGLDKFKRAYALGSWYGSIAQYILDSNIATKSIVLIDIDPKNTDYVNKNRLNERVHAITADCNKVQLDGGKNVLIINTSTNDILLENSSSPNLQLDTNTTPLSNIE